MNNNMTYIQKKEVEELVNFFKAKGFTKSYQISYYIQQNRIGYKFKHIAGYLTMSHGYNTWTFKGGIAPQFYGEICRRLGLTNKKSNSHVEGFKSYQERWNNEF